MMRTLPLLVVLVILLASCGFLKPVDDTPVASAKHMKDALLFEERSYLFDLCAGVVIAKRNVVAARSDRKLATTLPQRYHAHVVLHDATTIVHGLIRQYNLAAQQLKDTPGFAESGLPLIVYHGKKTVCVG
jgi:hypothetical protein